jgi:hypothetical protein
MTLISMPVRELEALSGELRRFAGTLADLEAKLARGSLQELELSLTNEELKFIVARDGAEIGTLAEGSRTLARGLREATELMQEMDRRSASGMPTMPRLNFSLPPISPPRLPWPYASPPLITPIPHGDLGDGQATVAGDRASVRAPNNPSARSFTA